jgi:PEP-CTERM motif
MHVGTTARQGGSRMVRLTTAASVAVMAASSMAQATTITDPANDFLTTFTGVRSSDLDVLSSSVLYDGTTLRIGATVNAPVGTLPTALYVFGVDRGAGARTSNFNSLGLNNVIFDSVITMTGAGVTGGRDLVSNTAITLPAGAARITGSSFELDIPVALLPSQGFQPQQYGINLWPRDSASPRPAGATTTDFQIADFAPNNATFAANAVAPFPAAPSPVPEPGTLALFGTAMALFAWRRHAQS